VSTERERLARKLKEAREAVGLSQDQVAKELELPRPAISQLENGNRNVAALELARLAKLYKQPLSFFSDDEPKESPRLHALHRTAKDLSEKDRDEVLRFAEFLRQKAEGARKRK
jgi:transcriptional regulator with XRE-family HTH domain